MPPHRASKAVGHIKRAVQSGWRWASSEGLALERELQQRLFESEDAREGIAASLAKREAQFTGTLTGGVPWDSLNGRSKALRGRRSSTALRRITAEFVRFAQSTRHERTTRENLRNSRQSA